MTEPQELKLALAFQDAPIISLLQKSVTELCRKGTMFGSVQVVGFPLQHTSRPCVEIDNLLWEAYRRAENARTELSATMGVGLVTGIMSVGRRHMMLSRNLRTVFDAAVVVTTVEAGIVSWHLRSPPEVDAFIDIAQYDGAQVAGQIAAHYGVDEHDELKELAGHVAASLYALDICLTVGETYPVQ